MILDIAVTLLILVLGVMDIFEVLKLILASFGGATVALLGLSKWLGNVWASRIIEKERARHSAELERLKSQLQMNAQKSSLYVESQFNLYNSLWESLHNLKIAGDHLWEEANYVNLERFSKQLRETTEVIGRRSLLIEDEHREQLMHVIAAFNDFYVGKERLIDLPNRYGENLDYEMRLKDDIKDLIRYNEGIVARYSNLIVDIQTSLRSQLR